MNRTNIILSILLVIVACLTFAGHVDYTRPNIEILPDMKYTPAWTAYRQNSVFANGRTLQEPVAGTIARGQMPLHFEATKEDALRAGEELQNPYADVDPKELQDSIKRGGDRYRVFCISCHGATGAGDGPVAKRGFPPPPSLLTGNSPKMKDGQLFHILTYGGQTSMPNFAAQLPPAQRWDVINYVRSMQPADETPAVPSSKSPGENQVEPTSPEPSAPTSESESN
ncbi:MAG: cytochrome c [Planctomycetaceae bacterium]|nr:cytochrome c [Planctomycetaceae bacterium]